MQKEPKPIILYNVEKELYRKKTLWKTEIEVERLSLKKCRIRKIKLVSTSIR